MKDQVDLLQKKGIKADLINSTLSKSAIDRILDNAIYGKTKMLYLSPERIQSELFQERLKKNESQLYCRRRSSLYFTMGI